MNDATAADLMQIPIDRIDRNEANPRIFFRQDEMEELLLSIKKHGIQVPVSVYRKGQRFVLIDGERRWRSSIKLNSKTIPALVQDEPSALNNLLLMFNIHSLREQWDLMTIAMKLPVVIDLLHEQSGQEPTESQISDQTGLRRGVIRRCKLLIELPKRYKEMMLRELTRPKSQQRFTEDFFIEMERALKTVERAMPEVVPDRDQARKVLIKKYKNNVITNIVQLRQIPKIARAESLDVSKVSARNALTLLFTDNSYTIEEAYESSVSAAYAERDLLVRIEGIVDRLKKIKRHDIDEDLAEHLRELLGVITNHLKS